LVQDGRRVKTSDCLWPLHPREAIHALGES
jgi:hypothetical protein